MRIKGRKEYFPSYKLINPGQRRLIGQSAPSIWPELEGIWNLISKFDSNAFELTSNITTERSLTLAVARFTRNLITANTDNQNLA